MVLVVGVFGLFLLAQTAGGPDAARPGGAAAVFCTEIQRQVVI